jgi:hypothetical protein
MDTRFSAERDEVGGMTDGTGRHPAEAGSGIAGERRQGMPEEAGS